MKKISIESMKLVKQHREMFDSSFDEAQAAIDAGWNPGKSRDGLAEIPPCLTFLFTFKSGTEQVIHICNANDTTGLTAEDVEEQAESVLAQHELFIQTGDKKYQLCRINRSSIDLTEVAMIAYEMSNEMDEAEFEEDDIEED